MRERFGMGREIRIECVNPPRAPKPEYPDGVARTVRQLLRPLDIVRFIVTTSGHERKFRVDGDVLIVSDLKKGTMQPASRLDLTVNGSSRIVSDVAAPHLVLINGSAAVEFEAVRGANVDIIDGLIVGLYRARIR
jgi:hypothetical protein